MDKKEFCYTCNEENTYDVKIERVEAEMGGVEFSYQALVAYCSKCGEEMSVPEVNDLNILRAYQKHKEILDKS